MKIAQIGTFDLDNLGDLLFPWVTVRILKHLFPSDTELVFKAYSPTEPRVLLYSDQVPYNVLNELDKDDSEGSFDLIFIGGGDLIRDDDYSLYPIYGTHSPQLTFSHILSPTATSQRRFALLGVGLPYIIEDDFSIFIANSLSRAISVGVRDERSALLLKSTTSAIDVQIVPDFVHCLPIFLGKDECKNNALSLLPDYQPGYFCFQGHADVCGTLSEVAKTLKEVEALTGKRFVLIEIGGCLGDTEFLHALSELTGYTVVSRQRYSNITLEQKVSIIGGCEGFIGSSLHGNIISNSYGINNISYVGDYSHKITEYFSDPKNGFLFNNFAACSQDAGKIAEILTTPTSVSTLNSDKHDKIFSFLRSLFNHSPQETTEFSSSIDNLYKLAHGKACYREGIVREQLANFEKMLGAEKENAVAQINYRQAMIDDLNELLREEKENAQQQIKYREKLIDELKVINLKEKENTAEQMQAKDSLIKKLQENQKPYE